MEKEPSSSLAWELFRLTGQPAAYALYCQRRRAESREKRTDAPGGQSQKIN